MSVVVDPAPRLTWVVEGRGAGGFTWIDTWQHLLRLSWNRRWSDDAVDYAVETFFRRKKILLLGCLESGVIERVIES